MFLIVAEKFGFFVFCDGRRRRTLWQMAYSEFCIRACKPGPEAAQLCMSHRAISRLFRHLLRSAFSTHTHHGIPIPIPSPPPSPSSPHQANTSTTKWAVPGTCLPPTPPPPSNSAKAKPTHRWASTSSKTGPHPPFHRVKLRHRKPTKHPRAPSVKRRRRSVRERHPIRLSLPAPRRRASSQRLLRHFRPSPPQPAATNKLELISTSISSATASLTNTAVRNWALRALQRTGVLVLESF